MDKAFVNLDGKPLIAHLLARLAPQVSRIAISANGDPARFAAFGLPVLADGTHAGKGPLAGLAAGLAWAEALGASSLLTIPVDTPFIPDDFFARLSPAPAVAVWQGRQHHLAAHWPVSVANALTDFLNAPGAHKVRDALALCHARQVIFTQKQDPFLNINNQSDLEAAKEALLFL